MTVYVNGEPVTVDEEQVLIPQTAKERIEELKEMLSQTDYKTLKYLEGALSEEEFAQSCALRSAWREEINLLEAEE